MKGWPVGGKQADRGRARRVIHASGGNSYGFVRSRVGLEI